MAFVSEVTAKMKIDKSGVDAALTSVVSSFGRAAENIQGQMTKAFSIKNAAKGLLQGLGIGTASDIKELIVKPFEQAAESAKRIQESTAETARIYERIFAARRTDEQNLEANRRDQARLQAELAEVTRQRTERVQTGFNPFTGQAIMEDRAVEQTAAQQERAAEIARELASLKEQEDKLTRGIGKEQKANDDRRMKAAQDFADKEQEIAQKQADFLRSQMTLEDQLADIERERMDLAERMANSDEDTIDLQNRELELLKEAAQIEREIADETARRNKEAEELARNLLRAGEAVTKSKADYQQELLDRSGLTLSEVANQRVNFGARQKARQIQRLEDEARKVRLTGGDFRDPKGNPMDRAQYAKYLTSRALEMRDSMGMLKKSEKDPMAAAAEAIKKSEEHLAEIKTDLKPTNIR